MSDAQKLIYPELSYKVVGLCFEVHNSLGPGHKEKYYSNALAELFRDRGVKYAREVYMPLTMKGSVVGKYFFDFIVEGLIVVEMKQGNRFTKKNIDQVSQYLKSSNLKLGIIVQFGTDAVKIPAPRHVTHERRAKSAGPGDFSREEGASAPTAFICLIHPFGRLRDF